MKGFVASLILLLVISAHAQFISQPVLSTLVLPSFQNQILGYTFGSGEGFYFPTKQFKVFDFGPKYCTPGNCIVLETVASVSRIHAEASTLGCKPLCVYEGTVNLATTNFVTSTSTSTHLLATSAFGSDGVFTNAQGVVFDGVSVEYAMGTFPSADNVPVPAWAGIQINLQLNCCVK